MAERDVLEALLLGMCADPQVSAEVIGSVASEMLLPVMTWPAEEAMLTLDARLAGTRSAEALQAAAAIWRPAAAAEQSFPGRRDQDGHDADESGVARRGSSVDSHLSAAAILAALRECAQAEDAQGVDLVGDGTGVVFSKAPPLVIRAILLELRRLGLADPTVGIIVRHAIAAGVVDVATEVLRDSARSLPVEGWRPYWDGGSRLRLFEEACAPDRGHGCG